MRTAISIAVTVAGLLASVTCSAAAPSRWLWLRAASWTSAPRSPSRAADTASAHPARWALAAPKLRLRVKGTVGVLKCGGDDSPRGQQRPGRWELSL